MKVPESNINLRRCSACLHLLKAGEECRVLRLYYQPTPDTGAILFLGFHLDCFKSLTEQYIHNPQSGSKIVLPRDTAKAITNETTGDVIVLED